MFLNWITALIIALLLLSLPVGCNRFKKMIWPRTHWPILSLWNSTGHCTSDYESGCLFSWIRRGFPTNKEKATRWYLHLKTASVTAGSDGSWRIVHEQTREMKSFLTRKSLWTCGWFCKRSFMNMAFWGFKFPVLLTVSWELWIRWWCIQTCKSRSRCDSFTRK